MKSKILSASLIWENMKKQIWIPVMILLALFIMYPVSLFGAFDTWNKYVITYPEVMKKYVEFISYILSRNGTMIMVGAALLNGIFGFFWLHSRQKVDFYHSLPIRREKLYWNQVLTGLLFYAVPEILVSILCLCIGASKGFFTMEVVGAMAVTVGLHILFYLMAYATTVLAMMLTGRILVGILGAIAFLTYIPGVIYLLMQYAGVFFTTYGIPYGMTTMDESIAAYGSSPLWHLKLAGQLDAKGSLAPAEIVCALVVSLGILVLNLWIYKKRPSEGTGKSMVFTAVGKVVKFLVVIPSALVVGLLAYEVAPDGSRLLWWIIGLLMGLVLIHGVMEIIYQMDFKKFFSHWVELGAEAVLVAAISLLFVFDIIGYDTYIPKQEEIAAVSFNVEDLTRETHLIIPKDLDKLKNYSYNVSELASQMQLKADDSLYSLLEKMVQKRCRFSWDNASEDSYGYGSDTLFIGTIYHLSNGKSVKRYYQISMDEEIRSQLNVLWNREDFREGMYKNIEDTLFLQNIGFDRFGYEQELYQRNDNDRLNFADALMEDIKDADMNTYLEKPVGKVLLYYGGGEGLSEYSIGANEVIIYPGYERTVKLLKEKGMVVAGNLDIRSITSISIQDYRKAINDGQGNAEISLTKPEDIEKILPFLTYPGYWSFQAGGEERDFSVIVLWKDQKGNEMESYFRLQSGHGLEEFA